MTDKTALDALFGAKKEASDSQLSKISDLLVAEAAATDAKETAEAMAAAARQQINTITQLKLPEAMLEAGIEEFKSAQTGTTVKIHFAADGSLGPKNDPEKEKKIDLLVANGGGEIVKQSVTVHFPKDQFEQAQALADRLSDDRIAVVTYFPKELAEEAQAHADKMLKTLNQETVVLTNEYENVECERSVHAAGLKKWVKDQMEKPGKDLPLDQLGIWYGQIAKITRPKKQK